MLVVYIVTMARITLQSAASVEGEIATELLTPALCIEGLGWRCIGFPLKV